MRTIRIGAGAGFAGDRIEPAVELAEHGALDVLVFECLAERTIALAQLARLQDPEAGFDPLLDTRMRAVLGACRTNGVKIITNAGAAHPRAAAQRVRTIAQRLGLRGVRIAAVTGDDVLRVLDPRATIVETGGAISDLKEPILSANAYLGAAPIVDALSGGADIVITGRVADPALFLAPMVHTFGWKWDDWQRLGRGTAAGHLLECAGQLTGGYFADPGYKEVPGLARLGFPIGEVDEEGTVVLSKVAGSGGCLTAATCTEQLLYEIHDPARYATPDVVADFSKVDIVTMGTDCVRVGGGTGHHRPNALKVAIGVDDGYVGEGQIAYAGPGAAARGRLALEIVRERLELLPLTYFDLRYELIGVDALHGPGLSEGYTPYEVRARVVGRAATQEAAAIIGNEVEALYTNGPAGGGGAVTSVRRTVGIVSTFLDRDLITPAITFFES